MTSRDNLSISSTASEAVESVPELVESDLDSIIKSPQKLEQDHIKFIMY